MTGRGPMPPFVHELVAGRRLERLRADRALTQEEVAKRCGWSQSKVVNAEQGTIRVQPSDLEKLFDVLEPGPDDRRTITAHLELGRVSAPKRDFRWKFKDDSLRKVVDMEGTAAARREHAGMIIPGLLQTEHYMRHLYGSVRPAYSDDEIEEFISLRLQRQQVLDHVDQQFQFSIDQAALSRMSNMPGARDQLLHLLAVSERPNVDLIFVPFSHGYYHGQEAEYAVFEYPADPTIHIVRVESHDGLEVLTDARTVDKFLKLWDEQRDAGLTPDEARPFLRFLSGASRSS
ncbi:helix-turn-helix domain-containing protein [Saccharothrix mutabilis subsp. capreolus]|uniref:helix-turn-helix domain-containing protein n=1 Tax=Saccharothrix mutabilis TaxID=33921 RepID=UPI0035E62A76|nr:helix-turn-helix transcriptional regulator [Saccharothrix mutabilis subsp. capreolus]